MFVVIAGFFAGLIGYITGLASIVSYPALLAVGIPPVAANVTNTVAMVAVGAGSMTNSAAELRQDRPQLLGYSMCCVGGGLVGAVTLLAAPAGTFEVVVPYLVALAALALLLQPLLRERAGDRAFPVLYPVGLFAVSIYGGYFGAGAGVMVLALTLICSAEPFWRASILKSFLLGLANLAAAISFAFFGPVHWLAGLAMGVGAFAGGWCGPPVVRRIDAKVLRIAVAVCGFGLAIWLAVR